VSREWLAAVRPGQSVCLDGPEGWRLVRVARARPGEAVELFDGAGRCVRGRVASVRHDALWCVIEGEVGSVEPPLPLVLVQAVAKGDRVARPEPGGSRVQRWQRVAESAARQCGRSVVPSVHGPMPWRQAAGRLAALEPGWLKLVAWEGAREPLPQVLRPWEDRPPAGVAVCVGPEGGLTEEEVQLMVEAGARPVSLGPRTLRTETAATVMLALVQAFLGDMAGPRP
jgi:16S rRNA (uracil1498-N3)-methyltransferase